MSTIKLSQLQNQGRVVREATAPFIYKNDDGVQVTEAFRFRYYSFSETEHEDQKAKVVASDKAGGGSYWADILLPVIESFPDLVDDEAGLPVPITRELLKSINGVNLQSIYQAIREAPLPKLPGTK